MSPSQDWIPLAMVVRAHGLRGELCVKSYNTESDYFERAQHIWLNLQGQMVSKKLLAAKRHQQMWLLSVEGVAQRSAAESVRGAVIYVPRAELPALQEGEFYLADLLGLAVKTTDGQNLGIVQNFVEYPTMVCLTVLSPTGIIEVPAMEPYLLEVKLGQSCIVVQRVEELMELSSGAPSTKRT